MKNQQVESWYAILQIQNFQGQTSNKKQPQTWWGRVRTPPRPSHGIHHCTSYGYGDWQVTTHKLILQPKVCFRVIDGIDGTPKERGNGHTTLKM